MNNVKVYGNATTSRYDLEGLYAPIMTFHGQQSYGAYDINFVIRITVMNGNGAKYLQYKDYAIAFVQNPLIRELNICDDIDLIINKTENNVYEFYVTSVNRGFITLQILNASHMGSVSLINGGVFNVDKNNLNNVFTAVNTDYEIFSPTFNNSNWSHNTRYCASYIRENKNVTINCVLSSTSYGNDVLVCKLPNSFSDGTRKRFHFRYQTNSNEWRDGIYFIDGTGNVFITTTAVADIIPINISYTLS